MAPTAAVIDLHTVDRCCDRQCPNCRRHAADDGLTPLWNETLCMDCRYGPLDT